MPWATQHHDERESRKWTPASGEAVYSVRQNLWLLVQNGQPTPQDLAQALARSGARIAMELDINPEWVQFDLAPAPGGTLAIALPGQVRPASQYLTGWTRDFVTVLAPPPPG